LHDLFSALAAATGVGGLLSKRSNGDIKFVNAGLKVMERCQGADLDFTRCHMMMFLLLAYFW